MADTDSTPRTGNKHNSDPDMPSADLMQYQLKELRAGVKESKEQNERIIGLLSDIKTQLALGKQEMNRHEMEIAEIRKVSAKSTAALVAALLTVIWELIQIVIPGLHH